MSDEKLKQLNAIKIIPVSLLTEPRCGIDFIESCLIEMREAAKSEAYAIRETGHNEENLKNVEKRIKALEKITMGGYISPDQYQKIQLEREEYSIRTDSRKPPTIRDQLTLRRFRDGRRLKEIQEELEQVNYNIALKKGRRK